MISQPSFTTLFQSSDFVHTYLLSSYKQHNVKAPETKAYENCYPFIYYIDMGSCYFQEGTKAPFALQPVLLFYGISHWLKAALLTTDPDYPADTQVLAHGLSSRKRKKQGYQFLNDIVRIQKNGLFPRLSEKLFHVKHMPGEKIAMRHLLLMMPEMRNLLLRLIKEQALAPLSSTDSLEEAYCLPDSQLDRWGQPHSSWKRKVTELAGHPVEIRKKDEDWFIKISAADFYHSNLFRKDSNGRVYVPVIQPVFKPLPEILTYYMVLYQLSMICRYETEWWGELLYSFSSDDLPIIKAFLNVAHHKSCLLLNDLFFRNKTKPGQDS